MQQIDQGPPESTVSLSEKYKEASEACRNYSNLTAKVRLLSQHVLLGYFVSLAIFSGELLYNQSFESALQKMKPILICSGIAIILFAISLWLIDWHYQSAFTAIRNWLASEEMKSQTKKVVRGPWSSHKKVRTATNDGIASYMPFFILSIVGVSAVWIGSAGKLEWLMAISEGGALLLFILYFVIKNKLLRYRKA
jgi:hypothetical protein